VIKRHQIKKIKSNERGGYLLLGSTCFQVTIHWAGELSIQEIFLIRKTKLPRGFSEMGRGGGEVWITLSKHWVAVVGD